MISIECTAYDHGVGNDRLNNNSDFAIKEITFTTGEDCDIVESIVSPGPVTSPTIAKPGFTVFPNPTHNSFQIDLQNWKNQQVTLNIFNASGQLIQVAKLVGGGLHNIETSNWSAGAYWVHMTNNQMHFKEKLIVIK